MKTLITCAFLLIFFRPVVGQKKGQALIDSLRAELPKAKADTNKVNTLLAITEKFGNIGNYDSSLLYANIALTLANKLKFETGSGSALATIAARYNDQGSYQASIKSYQDALSVFQGIGNKKGIARCLNGIGLDYIGLADSPKALEYLFKALAIYQQMKFKRGIGICLNNIGNVYKQQYNNPKALEYYLNANSIFQEMGFKIGLANSLMNIGNVYNAQGDNSKALEYYFKSLNVFQKTENKEGLAFIFGNISDNYSNQHDYPKALEYGFKALALNRETGDMPQYGVALVNVGSIYTNQKKYAVARMYLDSALEVTKKTKEKRTIEDVYQNMAVLDSMKGDYKTGWEDYKNYNLYHDSLINEANIKKTTQAEMNYEFGRKTDSTKAEQDKLAAVAGKESQRQKVIRNSFIGGFSITFLASGLFFYQRKRIAKEKKRSENLLLNILPAEVADELKAKGSAEARDFDEVTVMFTDFKDFTKISEQLTSAKLVAEINYCFSAFDAIIDKYGIEKIKTIGDSYMCAGGLPVKNITHSDDVVNAALDIKEFMAQYKRDREAKGELPFEIRIGVHTGPVVAGIVGVKKFAYDIWGDTVNIASRMESSGEAGKINISGSTYELVKNDFTCIHRGKIQAKNKGDIDMYFVKEKIAG